MRDESKTSFFLFLMLVQGTMGQDRFKIFLRGRNGRKALLIPFASC